MHAVLVDVGGTLLPDAWPVRRGDLEQREAQVRAAVPNLTSAQASDLVSVLAGLDHPGSARQQTASLVRRALRRVAPATTVGVPAVIAAMVLPALGRVEPFPGARPFLEALAGRGVRVIVVSNVLWRDAVAQRRDFDDLGLSAFVAAYVMSIDVGWRKPDARFFDAALAAAGCDAHECALVGNSERNDIQPARARGMLSVRVALEEPLPPTSAADLVTGSLLRAMDYLLDRAGRA